LGKGWKGSTHSKEEEGRGKKKQESSTLQISKPGTEKSLALSDSRRLKLSKGKRPLF